MSWRLEGLGGGVGVNWAGVLLTNMKSLLSWMKYSAQSSPDT
jgi:hypothetical protein